MPHSGEHPRSVVHAAFHKKHTGRRVVLGRESLRLGKDRPMSLMNPIEDAERNDHSRRGWKCIGNRVNIHGFSELTTG